MQNKQYIINIVIYYIKCIVYKFDYKLKDFLLKYYKVKWEIFEYNLLKKIAKINNGNWRF